ncbi:hypothetical protein GCM10027416_24150 [Okibacterium endophyticum]
MRSRRGTPAYALTGAAAALIGLVPWLITGIRLPLQNLWAAQTPAEQMPIALLPFSQYQITTIIGLIVTGYAAAGITVRLSRAYHPRRVVLATACGALAVDVLAAVQTTVVVLSGLQQRTASHLYVAALLAVVVLAIIVGLLVLRLIATAQAPGAIIGLSLAALAVGLWLTALVAPLTVMPTTLPTDAREWLLSSVRWVPAVLVGLAIAWGGVRSRGRIIATVGSILILWVGPAAFTGVSAAAGARMLLPYPAEMLDYGIGVFRMALFVPELALPPLIVAIAVAGIGVVVRELVLRRRRDDLPAAHEHPRGERVG